MIEVQQDTDSNKRRDGHNERLVGEDAEHRAGICGIGEAEETIVGHGLVEAEVALDQGFGDLVNNHDYREYRYQQQITVDLRFLRGR